MAAPSWAARLAAVIETPIRWTGALCGVCTLSLVLLMFGLVVMRYGFDKGSIALQELVLHLNAAAFLLGGAYALLRDAHVRVDILQQRWSPQTQRWAELAGLALLLLPFCAVLLWTSLDYVAMAWSLREGSREAGGLPGLYVVKSLIPVSAVLLMLAGAARALRLLAAAPSPTAPAMSHQGGGA